MALPLVIYARPKYEDVEDDLFSSSPPGTSALGLRWVRHCTSNITRLERVMLSRENPVWWNDCAVLCITSYLGFNEFSRFALVNKLAVRLSTFEPLWERHCQREFGCRRTEIEPRPSSSRELFKFLFEKMGMMYKNSREASFSQMLRARGKVTLA